MHIIITAIVVLGVIITVGWVFSKLPAKVRSDIVGITCIIALILLFVMFMVGVLGYGICADHDYTTCQEMENWIDENIRIHSAKGNETR